MTVITRFAPSPTGFLHIGGARTALFNYLYTKANNGKFLLRIEDTDIKRSSDEAKQAILDGLDWLNINYDDKVIFQSENSKRHAEIAHELVKRGHAYYCYSSSEDLEKLRSQSTGNKTDISRIWRDNNKEIPKNITPTIRIKVPLNTTIEFHDAIQGKVSYDTNEIDDFIILRADNSPTYMLSASVDDHDMKITDVIRGNDHLTNSFKQIIIFNAMGWDLPKYSHLGLIHGEDGSKLSKRHGALGVMEYKKMGFLPDAINNYLLRLGWGHGNTEIIDRNEVIKLFQLKQISKSPSRFDMKKLLNLNAQYIKKMTNEDLFTLIKPILLEKYNNINTHQENILVSAIGSVKKKAKTIIEIMDQILFFITDCNDIDIQNIIVDLEESEINNFKILSDQLFNLDDIKWNKENLYNIFNQFATDNNLKINDLVKLFRLSVCYSNISPSLFNDVFIILGKNETITRIKYFIDINKLT